MALKVLRFGCSSGRLFRVFRAQYATSAAGEDPSSKDSMAAQMVDYANSFRKKGDAGYLDAMQVLEHGLSFMKSSGDSAATALCKIQLTIANFHADNGKLADALEILQSVADNASAPLEVRASALEALAGLHLQTHEDNLAAAQAQAISKLCGSADSRSTGLAGLIKLSEGQYDAACLEKFPSDAKEGTTVLSCAEIAHVRGKNTEAKNLYENAMRLAKEVPDSSRGLAGPTMTADEVQMAALAGLGQLSTGHGQYEEAEKSLTDALHIAETISGETHARVGMVLSCMAHLYTRRAKTENTGFMLAEGLYRRSLTLLKAPPLDKDTKEGLHYVDAVALTRARYAEILSSVEQRKAEGEKLRSWAGSVWKNRRSLSELLEGEGLLEVRLGRVF